MSHPSHAARRRTGVALISTLALLLACFGLAACGSSSSKTTTTVTKAAASATAPSASGATGATTTPSTTTPGSIPHTGPSGPTGAHGFPGASRFAEVRECLAKQGITLPKATGARPGAGGFLGRRGAQQLPKGVTRAQFEAAEKKCGGNFRGAPGRGSQGVHSAGFRQALVRFEQCLRKQGIDIPAPNTSGKGPIFDTKGLDTGSPKFRAAATKCRGALLTSLKGAAPRAAGGASTGATGSASPAG